MGIDNKIDETLYAIQPPQKRKAGTQQQQPRPAGQHPVQETFMMREYTPSEFIDVAAKFQQKGRKGFQAWSVQLWDSGDGISLTGQETEHEQYQWVQGTHSFINWCRSW